MRLIKFLSLFLLIQNSLYADYLEVTLLGTGTPRPVIDRFGPATLVNAGGKYFLFDVGRGVTIRLQQAGITPDQIEQVFITHLHSDHISGLDDLWLTGRIWQRENLLNVYGPAGTHTLVENLRSAYQADIAYRAANVDSEDAGANIDSREINAGIVYQNGAVTIRAFYVEHRPVFPAFGYRLSFGDRSVVISGDTTYSENLIKQSKGVDVLIHEIAAASESLLKRNKRLNSILAYHTNPRQMAEILLKTNPRISVLNHVLLFAVTEENVIKTIKNRYTGKVLMGADLMKLSVGKSINVQSIGAN